jgi:hypothetical protein
VRAVATTASSRMQHDHRVAEGFGHRFDVLLVV